MYNSTCNLGCCIILRPLIKDTPIKDNLIYLAQLETDHFFSQIFRALSNHVLSPHFLRSKKSGSWCSNLAINKDVVKSLGSENDKINVMSPLIWISDLARF